MIAKASEIAVCNFAESMPVGFISSHFSYLDVFLAPDTKGNQRAMVILGYLVSKSFEVLKAYLSAPYRHT
jgi:hypothetical protein